MKKRSVFFMIILLSVLLFSCSKEKPDDTEILANINDYSLTLEEFQSRLAAELEMDNEYKLTRKAREDFLEDIIKKELLIQEAKKLRLDEQDRFIKAIERYWEATLIKDLMEIKGEEISKKTLVSEEEIRARYDMMSTSRTGIPSLEEMERDIEEEIRERKKTEKLKEWIEDLRRKANIEIDSELLYKD